MSTKNHKKGYEKPAKTIDEQLNILRNRKLILNDEEEVIHYLNNIGYYHLSGYFKIFQDNNDIFFKETSFKKILDIYFFDRKLRLLFLNALERIEKSFKTQFAYVLSIKYGASYLTESDVFQKHKQAINERLEKSKEPFIKSFKEKYTNQYPPLWILVETLSFGDLLNIFRSLETKDKKSIAQKYNLGWVYLYSWLENLREIRNCCAHYSRLWNRKITKHLKEGSEYSGLQYNKYIFDSIFITGILLKIISPSFDWINRIENLINEYSIDVNKMGFPDNWKNVFINYKI
jgi:abortive infection bacteriophage resistance protein